MEQVEQRVARFYEKADYLDQKGGFAKFSHKNIISRTRFPKDIIEDILNGVIESYEPYKINNLEMILQTLLSFSLVCKEFHVIVFDIGIPKLTQKIITKTSQPKVDSIISDKFTIDPLSLTAKQLKLLAETYKTRKSGTKIYLVHDLLQKFIMFSPCCVPLCVRAELIFDRCFHHKYKIICQGLYNAIRNYISFNPRDKTINSLYQMIKSVVTDNIRFRAIKKIYSCGLYSSEDVYSKQIEIEQKVKDYVSSKKKKVKFSKHSDQRCECGNHMSDKCENVCCGKCCTMQLNHCSFHRDRHWLKKMEFVERKN